VGNGKTRTPILQNEDWWACFLGWFIVVLALVGQSMVTIPDEMKADQDAAAKKIEAMEKELAAKKEASDGSETAVADIKALTRKIDDSKEKVVKTETKHRVKEGIVPKLPKIGTWESFGEIYPKGGWFTDLLIVFVGCTVLLMIGGYFLKHDLKLFVPGFLVIFALAMIADIIAKQHWIKTELQFSPVFFALLFGLLISNIFKVPGFIVAARQTEYFVKIGLVCMGSGILFGDVIRAGVWGLLQAILVATVVWFMTYWICRRFKVSERFSAIIATANSICGVSATIAAGGAIQGKPKEVSYMVAWVLVCAVVLIFVMPPIAMGLGMSPAWAGAWVGGVIDNTGAVVAAGEAVETKWGEAGGDVAVKVASVVKMAQNVLIGFVAFFMALWATLSLEKKEAGADYEKPSLAEVWYRFPKFVVGFLVASLLVSLLDPAIGTAAVKAVGKECKVYRDLFFGLCFVSIGLETNFKELVSVGGGRPAIAYWLSQAANAVWTLFITWILWSDQVLPSPF
jgi:uncharacterized membrane protein YadS